MQSGLNLTSKYAWPLLFGLILLVYLFNLPIEIMEIDAAQYANMSLEMLQTGNYLQVYDQGQDYLDKPPLLFWLSSFSISIFGVSNWAYKLPALLVLIFGVYSTYRLALIWYNDEIAKMAAALLACSNAYFLMTNDVRTDGMLTSFIIYAVWQLVAYDKNKKLKNVLGAGLGTGLAMLSKGPIGMVIVLMAVGSDWLIRRRWKTLFSWHWIIYLLVIALVLVPMCYGLYQQYDLHPEKKYMD